MEEAYELGCSQMISFVAQETPVFKKKPLIPTLINTDIPVFDDVIPPNPYQGLAAFEEEDADFFFGQENFINKLVEVTQNQPLVGIIAEWQWKILGSICRFNSEIATAGTG